PTTRRTSPARSSRSSPRPTSTARAWRSIDARWAARTTSSRGSPTALAPTSSPTRTMHSATSGWPESVSTSRSTRRGSRTTLDSTMPPSITSYLSPAPSTRTLEASIRQRIPTLILRTASTPTKRSTEQQDKICWSRTHATRTLSRTLGT
ncbi:CRE-PCP-1 protein, partial [Aphelenchoides avenae]